MFFFGFKHQKYWILNLINFKSIYFYFRINSKQLKNHELRNKLLRRTNSCSMSKWTHSWSSLYWLFLLYTLSTSDWCCDLLGHLLSWRHQHDNLRNTHASQIDFFWQPSSCYHLIHCPYRTSSCFCGCSVRSSSYNDIYHTLNCNVYLYSVILDLDAICRG